MFGQGICVMLQLLSVVLSVCPQAELVGTVLGVLWTGQVVFVGRVTHLPMLIKFPHTLKRYQNFFPPETENMSRPEREGNFILFQFGVSLSWLCLEKKIPG